MNRHRMTHAEKMSNILSITYIKLGYLFLLYCVNKTSLDGKPFNYVSETINEAVGATRLRDIST